MKKFKKIQQRKPEKGLWRYSYSALSYELVSCPVQRLLCMLQCSYRQSLPGNVHGTC